MLDKKIITRLRDEAAGARRQSWLAVGDGRGCDDKAGKYVLSVNYSKKIRCADRWVRGKLKKLSKEKLTRTVEPSTTENI